MHENTKLTVNRLNYEVMEIVSTSAVLNENTYMYLEDNLSRIGDYKILLRLEKIIKPGIYDTYYDKENIIDKHLQIGDKLTAYLEDKKPTIFGRLINACLIGNKNNEYVDTCIKSVRTCVVSKNLKNLVKGYDVIADIEDRYEDEGVAVLVVTKLNSEGKYYGTCSHEYVEMTNLHYGDSTDEQGNTGMNYIFDNGDFIKEVLYYPTGLEKLVKYIQQ